MNIDNIKQALEILLKEISPKATGTKEQSILINSIAELQSLVKRLNNPIKSKHIDKLINGK